MNPSSNRSKYENSAIDEKEDYLKDLVKIGQQIKNKENLLLILENVNTCSRKYLTPAYKAHFHFLYATALGMQSEYEKAYYYYSKIRDDFPDTIFSHAASDFMMQLFIDSGGGYPVTPPFVPKVQIEPTRYCNINCIMCGRDQNKPNGHMNFETFSKVIDQGLEAGANNFMLYHMGEPLMNKNLVRFVSYITEKINKFSFKPPCFPRNSVITTNGLLLNEKKADELMKAGLSILSVSIDGRNKDEYEAVRKGANYDLLLDNLKNAIKIRNAKQYRTQINICTLDMGMSQEDQKKVKRFYQTLGVDYIYINPTAQYQNRKILTNNGIMIDVDSLPEKKNKKINENSQHTQYSNPNIDRIVVLWNGDIQAHCGECGQESILGNIRDLSLKEAYRLSLK